jgi:hypothetical protein
MAARGDRVQSASRGAGRGCRSAFSDRPLVALFLRVPTTKKTTRKKKTTRLRTRRPTPTDAWAEQGALAALDDARRAGWRARLARFDDAALRRMHALFSRLGHVVALEIPADDATIEVLVRAHDLFFPALSVLQSPRREDRILAALGPIMTACAETYRGGEAREHARFARWQLARHVDPAFGALDIDQLAAGMGGKARRARRTPEDLLVAWNAKAGGPLGRLTRAAISKARRA